MKKLFKNKPLMILIGAVLLMAVLALATSGSRSVTWIESAVGSVVEPVNSFAVKASNDIIDFFERLFKTTDADKENEQLKLRIAQLEQVEAELSEAKAENTRLKELLNYVESTEVSGYITASVIGKSQGIWFNVITVNAGRNQGVKEDMPAISAGGLVGRVTDVGATWCKVTAVIDSLSNVSVMVDRTRDNCMIRGTLGVSGSDELELYYLPGESDLVPGDTIVTNGIGGIFPKGIVVGTVIEVARRSDDLSDRNAIVAPAVDFTRIEEVMILVESSPETESDQ